MVELLTYVLEGRYEVVLDNKRGKGRVGPIGVAF